MRAYSRAATAQVLPLLWLSIQSWMYVSSHLACKTSQPAFPEADLDPSRSAINAMNYPSIRFSQILALTPIYLHAVTAFCLGLSPSALLLTIIDAIEGR
jgi:hypothetical protein